MPEAWNAALLTKRFAHSYRGITESFYAAVIMDLAGISQGMFAPTFTTSRVVGWGAHLLEQAADNKIMRPTARYVGPPIN